MMIDVADKLAQQLFQSVLNLRNNYNGMYARKVLGYAVISKMTVYIYTEYILALETWYWSNISTNINKHNQIMKDNLCGLLQLPLSLFLSLKCRFIFWPLRTDSENVEDNVALIQNRRI